MFETIGNIGTAISAIISLIALFVAIQVNHQASLPQVIVYLSFDKDHQSVDLVVTNIGRGVAKNIKLSSFDKTIISAQFLEQVNKSFVMHGIPLLVPNSSRETTIAAESFFDELKNKETSIKVSYISRGLLLPKREYMDEFYLDYSSFAGSIYTKSDLYEIKNILKKTEKDLAGVKEEIKCLRESY